HFSISLLVFTISKYVIESAADEIFISSADAYGYNAKKLTPICWFDKLEM
ncbi:hypothetical protein RYX36_003245, partial [Vicia faba]